MAFLQRTKCSNKKIEENKSGLEFNFLLKSKWASLNFDFLFLTEPYYAFMHFFVAKSTSAQVEGVVVGDYADFGNAEL